MKKVIVILSSIVIVLGFFHGGSIINPLKANLYEEELQAKVVIKELNLTSKTMSEPTEIFTTSSETQTTFPSSTIQETVPKTETTSETASETTSKTTSSTTEQTESSKPQPPPPHTHTYNTVSSKQATPFEEGLVVKRCECGKEVQTTSPKIEVKGMYIPSVGINTELTWVDFIDQNAVNTYSTVAAENYTTKINRENYPDEQNVTIMGHNYGVIYKICNSKVGDLIYIKKNNEIQVWEITISEEAYVHYIDWNGYQIDDFWLIKTKDNFMTSKYKEKENLTMYTCYGKNNRWCVLAKRIQ